VRSLNFANAAPRLIDRALAAPPQQAVSQLDYANRRHRHALTVVPQDVLAQRRPVAPAAGRFAPRSLVQRLATQPPQAVMLPGPPVAPPATAGGRGGRFTRVEPQRSGTMASPAAPPPARVIVPSARSRPVSPSDRFDAGASPSRLPRATVQPAMPAPRWPSPAAAPSDRQPRVALPATPSPAARLPRPVLPGTATPGDRPPRVAVPVPTRPATAQPAPGSRWTPRAGPVTTPPAARPPPARPAPAAPASREWRGSRDDAPTRRGDHRFPGRER
jgi:hypothetical protein